ncbi:MAG TPA: matrixin family metalloprotease [Rheinheimera sp.]|nr:matrixin family metalloprotease [Rheinheimera sp.]
MKFLLRALFYTALLYGSYQLLSGLLQKEPKLPPALQDYADNAMQQYLCRAPVSWRIGQLDPAFALTLDDAEQAAHAAAAQWNSALGTELFRYDSIDGFPINFAYDERQQTLLQQALLQRNLQRYDDNINQRADSLQQQSARLQQQQRQFAQQNQQFSADVAAFQRKVQQTGNASRSALQAEQQQLNQRQQQLQQQADRLNAEQQQLLRQQRYLNDTVADRNALLPQQADQLAKAEVGLMEIRGQQRVMTIFAYKTLADLQLTMLHEFGHALGLGHTDSPASVMHFALNPQQSSLTDEDIHALQAQCAVKPH